MFPKTKTYNTYPESLRKDPVLWSQVLLALIFFIAVDIWLSVVPRQVKFNLGHNETILGLTGFCLAATTISLRPIMNKYGPLIARKVLLLIGILVLMLSGIMAIISDSLVAVFIIRACVGIGDAIFFVTIISLITSNAKHNQQGFVLGLYSVSLYMGVAFGPAIGEKIYHWNEADVWINSGIVVTALALVLLVILFFLPVRITKEDKTSKKTASFCPPAILPGIIMMLGNAAWIGLQQFAPIFASSVGIKDVTLLFIIMGAGIATIRIVFSSLLDKINSKVLLAMALSFAVIAAIIFSNTLSSGGLYSGSIFMVLSNGFFYPSCLLIALKRGQEYEKVSVVGTLSMFWDLMFGLLPPILGFIATQYGYTWMFKWIVVLVLGALIVALCVKIPAFKVEHEEVISEPDALV